MTNPHRIGTHDGTFHADEVVGVGILHLVFAGNIEIVRTRKSDVLATCEILLDVGLQYDPARGMFDHHQPEFDLKRSDGVMFASAGLIWKTFGTRLTTPEIAASVDRAFIRHIDAIDYGKPLFTGEAYSFSRIVTALNPTWQEAPDYDAAFHRAALMAATLVEREIAHAQAGIAAEAVVKRAMEAREDSRIVVMDEKCPWERTISADANVLFVVQPDTTGGWRINTVPNWPDPYSSRKLLPAAWGGKDGADFVAVTGIADARFCHRARFVAGAGSKDSAIALAKLAADATD